MNFHDKLISILTQYDQKQSTKKFYNVYALGHYFTRADDVKQDIELGASPRAAIVAGFTGPLCNFILKKFGLDKLTEDEQYGSGVYRPVSKNHPVYSDQ